MREHLFERVDGPAIDGAATTVAWLRHALHMSKGAASERVQVARQLEDLPALREACNRGTVGIQNAGIIARTATQIGIDAVKEAENALVDAAQRLEPGLLWRVTQHLRHCVDPDGELDTANAVYERRCFYVGRTFDGVHVLNGELDSESGEIVRAALEALMPVTAKDDGRTPRQRRADALVEMARRQLNGGSLPRAGGVRPHLTMTVDAAELRREPGAKAAELARDTVLPTETARRVACDAALTVVVTSANGQPLSVGRATRTIPAAMRRLLVLRDGGCVFTGCDRPPEWTDGHHITHWADGGETAPENLVLLCRFHHRMTHEGGWHFERTLSGEWTPIRPRVAAPMRS